MNISVVIPTYNRASTIRRAIDSVLAQTYRNFDLWIVDDGSTDDTEELVTNYHCDEINIHYLKQSNSGVSSARNLGIRSSSSDWIAFLDSDDEWLPHRLQKQVDLLHTKPELLMVYGDEIWVRNGKRVNPKFIHKKHGGDIFKQCLALCFIAPSASLIKRKLLDEVGLFDQTFTVCEDYDLWLKISSLYPIGFVNEAIIVKHGGHEDQLSTKYFAMDYFRVLSMDRISAIRSLSEDHLMALEHEILKKSRILLKGYIKHKNMDHFEEIHCIARKIDPDFVFQD